MKIYSKYTKALTSVFLASTAITGCVYGTANAVETGTESIEVSQAEKGYLFSLGLVAENTKPLEEQPVVLEESNAFIITYKEGTAKDISKAEEVVSNVTDLDAETTKTSIAGNDDYVVVEVDKLLNKEEQSKVIDELKNSDSNIKSVEKDAIVKNVTSAISGSREQYWGQLWDKQVVKAQSSWDLGVTGAGQQIAVVDTGYTNHPDLDGNRVNGYDVVSTAWQARDGDGRDTDPRDMGTWSSSRNSSWHGTNVASIAVGQSNGTGIVGIAPEAKFQPIRVLSYDDSGSISDIADGIYQSAGGRVSGLPANTKPSTVINASLSYPGSCSSYMQDAINFAVNKGIPVVVASGNTGTPAINNAPGNCANVITVGATALVSGNQVVTGYSNYGGAVDIVAPGGASGSSIFQAGNFGTTTVGSAGYVYKNGTSMATPQVAGAIALMKQANPNLNAYQIKSMLLANSDLVSGYRSLNVEKAVKAALSSAGRSSLLTNDRYINNFRLTGAIGAKYFENTGLLGVPTSNEYNITNNGVAQTFSNGYIVYWSEASGAHIMNMNGVIFNYFKARGYEDGFGFPTSDQYAVSGGVAQDFRLVDGRTQTIYYNNATQTANHVWNPGGIGWYFNSNGGVSKFGVPITNEIGDSGIVYQNFSNNRIITWSPETDTHSIVRGGDIYWRWINTGGAGKHGAFSADERTTVQGEGALTYTKRGTAESVFVWSPRTGTKIMNSRGAIYYKWLEVGGSNFGYPTTDEYTDNEGVTKVVFSNGSSINWTSQRGVWISK